MVTARHGPPTAPVATWNCTHIANATMRGRIEEVCRAAAFEPPIICTRSHSCRIKEMRYPDPITKEIRAIRYAIAMEFDYDLEKIARAIKEREVASGRVVVRLPPRRPEIRKAS